MFVVIRRYKGASQLMDAFEEGRPEVERLLRDVRGFIAYYFFRSGDGGASVTVCEDRMGAEESNLLAADWITEHASTLHGNVPEVIEGETFIHLTRDS